jgi:hypothetical protein
LTPDTDESFPSLRDRVGRRGHLFSNFQRNCLNAVAIAVNQIAGFDRQPSYYDRSTEIEDVSVRMGDGNITGK